MIVVIGEALIDLIEDRERVGNFAAVVGGANANVALALAKRGTPHDFLGRISDDRFGQLIRAHLLEGGVSLAHSVKASETTTLAVVSLNNHGSPTYSFYVNGTADWAWTPAELPSQAALAQWGATALQFGCLTMAMQPSGSVIEAWARPLYEGAALTISHDVNIRPALGFDPEHERARVERVNGLSHVVKASDEDIAWLYGDGSATKIDTVAREWVGDSNRIVLITRGGDGVSVYRRSTAEHAISRLDVPPRRVSVVDTVGAGDTFCANFLAELDAANALGSNPFARLANLTDEQIFQFARVAGVAASITCERQGCQPPTLAELAGALDG